MLLPRRSGRRFGAAQGVMKSDGTVFDRLKQIIVDQLGVDEAEVVPEASFVDDLNADSLDLVELIMTLEEKFDLRIKDDEAEEIKTVGNALDYIEEHLH